MKEFFEAFPVLAWSGVSVMLALITMSLLWRKLQWWWHNTWYSFPLVGKVTSLSKDINKDSADPTWFKAERTLCRDYKKFIRIQDEHDFHEKINYLTKAGDNGRGHTPGLIWLLTIALVFVEAMGFSYVLAGYTLPGASENMQQYGALGIAFLISVILVAFTHFAGSELYKSGKVKTARQEWAEGGRKGKISGGTVPLARQQSVDDDQPGYSQLMNRVGTQSGYYLTIGTVIFVSIVAIGATYVRGQVLEKQLHQQVMGQSSGGGAELSVKLTQDGLNMSVKESGGSIKLPADDAAQNRRANDKAAADDASIDQKGGWGTFIVLAVIFVFLQILGVFFGFKWGFAGKDSAAAYRAIGEGRYSSYADVREHYKDIADTAQSKLEHLQQKMMNRNTNYGGEGTHTTRTFYDFMDAERNRETDERSKELRHASQRSALEKAHAPAVSVSSASPAATLVPTAETLESTLHKLSLLGDNRDGKKTFINSLSAPLRAEVLQALTRQKEADEAKKASKHDAELDALLDR